MIFLQDWVQFALRTNGWHIHVTWKYIWWVCSNGGGVPINFLMEMVVCSCNFLKACSLPWSFEIKLPAPREFQIYLAAVCIKVSLRIHIIHSTTTLISLSPDVIWLSVLTTIALELWNYRIGFCERCGLRLRIILSIGVGPLYRGGTLPRHHKVLEGSCSMFRSGANRWVNGM